MMSNSSLWQWLFLLPLPVLIAVGIWAFTGNTTEARRPLPPSTQECNPAVRQCALGEYLEFREKAVSSIYVDGVLSHCKEGFCLMGQPYSEFAPYRTPEELAAVIGCPNLQDSIEAFAIMREWVAAGPSRMSLQMGERACTTMNTAHNYEPPIVTMPVIIITARSYPYGGPGVEARAESNARAASSAPTPSIIPVPNPMLPRPPTPDAPIDDLTKMIRNLLDEVERRGGLNKLTPAERAIIDKTTKMLVAKIPTAVVEGLEKAVRGAALLPIPSQQVREEILSREACVSAGICK